MNKTFQSSDFGWGTIDTNSNRDTYGDLIESSTNVNTGFRNFDGNLENYTLEIEFEKDMEPAKTTFVVYVFLYDKYSNYITYYSHSKSNFAATETEDGRTIYTLKEPKSILGIISLKKLTEFATANGYPNAYGFIDYIMTYVLAVKISSGKDDPTQADCINHVNIKSLYKLNLKNGKILAIDAPDIQLTTYVSPIPASAWRIDGIYNHGFPYIKRSKDIPYSMRVPPYETISLMDQIRVTSLPHGLNDLFPVTKMSIPLDKPEETKYTLGSTQTESMTTSSNSVSSDLSGKLKEVPKASTILSLARSNAANLLKAATNGFVTLHQKDGHCDEIIISDEPDYTTAKNVWRWNVNGLGFSDHGYDADEWKAAITMDGAIVADRITAGTMFADRIHGGTLTLGGYDNVNGELRVIAGRTENDKHAVVKMDKDGAYIEGRTISKNIDNGYSMVLKNGHIYSYTDYDEGKQDNEDNMVGYIHMTNRTGESGKLGMGMGFYSTGPIIFNCPSVWITNDPNNEHGSHVCDGDKIQVIKYISDVSLKHNGEDSWSIEKTESELRILSGFCLTEGDYTEPVFKNE